MAEQTSKDTPSLMGETGAPLSDISTFDIILEGKRVGKVFNVNPICIETDKECRVVLTSLKEKTIFSESERELLDQCLLVVSASNGDDLNFGPGEIIAIGDMAQAHPEYLHELMACSTHLSDSIDYQGDIPSDILLVGGKAHLLLDRVFNAAMKMGTVSEKDGIFTRNSDQVEDYDPEEPLTEDEDFEESLTEDEDFEEPLTEDEETGEKETSEKEETGEKETNEKEISEKETSEKETSEKETSEKETGEKETSEKETSEKETDEKEISEKEIGEKETGDKETNGKESDDSYD